MERASPSTSALALYYYDGEKVYSSYIYDSNATQKILDELDSVKATEVGHSSVTLLWEPGFDGGHQNTQYFVSYRRVLASAGDDTLASDCYGTTGMIPKRSNGEGWQEFDCQRNNPCNVTSLEQHHTYVFKVSWLKLG
jgi:hypothetical protein